MLVTYTIAAALDVNIRNVGWHFMWFAGSYSRLGAGRTAESAIGKAITLALNQVNGRFNAAELDCAVTPRTWPTSDGLSL